MHQLAEFSKIHSISDKKFWHIKCVWSINQLSSADNDKKRKLCWSPVKQHSVSESSHMVFVENEAFDWHLEDYLPCSKYSIKFFDWRIIDNSIIYHEIKPSWSGPTWLRRSETIFVQKSRIITETYTYSCNS